MMKITTIEMSIKFSKDYEDGDEFYFKQPGSKYGEAGNKVHRRGRCNKILSSTIKSMRFHKDLSSV